MKKIIGAALFVWVLVAGSAHAGNFTVDVNVNPSVIEGRAGLEHAAGPGMIEAGIGAIYDEDDYALGSLDVRMGNPVFLPDLRFSMGLKGIWGEVDKTPDDADVGVIGFLVSALYEPMRVLDVPLEITGLFCGAFGPMCFGDADGYAEFKTTVGLQLLRDKRGTIYTGYRYLKLDFEDDFNGSGLSENEIFLGFKLRF